MSSIWIAIGLYSAAAIYLGWRWHEPAETGAQFWTAGRDLGAGAVGLSISAGFMSISWSCVYATQLFYGYGLGGLLLITLPWLLALGGIYWLARRYRSLPAFSQPEMVAQRFGPGAGRTVALAVAFVFLVWGGAEIYVAAKLLAPGLGISQTATVLGITAVVGLYSALGGLRAVVATDKLQYTLVAFYVMAVAWLAWRAVEGQGAGWPPAALVAPRTGASWRHLMAPGAATILLTLLAYLPGWIFETDLWVRVQAARDARAARRGMLIAGANALVFVGLLPLFIGVAALVLFPAEAGAAPPVLGQDGDAIFAAIIERYAPAWLSALVAVGLVAAAMSTIDTCANVMALSLAYDLLGLHKRPRAGRNAKLVMAGVMVASCLFALNTESLWDIFYLSSGVLSTTVAFPVAAVFWRQASPRGVLYSSLAGFVTTVVAYFLAAAGLLAGAEPGWLASTGLGYIVWGLIAAAIGYALGATRDHAVS